MLFSRSSTDVAFQSMALYGHMADNEIVQKVRAGKKECFEVLMRRHTQALYRVGRMFDFEPHDIEELIAEVYALAYRSLGSYKNSGTFRHWLTRIMIDACSRKLVLSNSISDHTSEANASTFARAFVPSRNCTANELLTVEAADVDELPVPLRSLFVLREVEGFSERETASLLNVSEDCVKQGTSKAKLSVKKSLRKNFFGDAMYPFASTSCERLVSQVMNGL